MKPKHFYRSALILITVFFSVTSFSQTSALGGWYIVNYNYHFNKKFVLYTEVQTRSQHLVNDFFYHELKAGISYNLSNSQSVFVGFGNYETHPFPGNYKKPVAVNENRIWEQYTMSNNIDRIKFEHRYRIEQRWLNGDFNNRFRYRLLATIPVNHSTMVANTFFTSAFDEVFFTNKAPYFLRNRVLGGVGFLFNKGIMLQTGFIRQFDYRTTDNGSGKNYILTSLIINAGHASKVPHHSDAD